MSRFGYCRFLSSQIILMCAHKWDPWCLQLVNPLRWEFIVIQSLGRVQLFVTPQTTPCQVSLSFVIFQSLLKLMSIELVMPSNHLVLCRPLLLPSIFPSFRLFSSELALRIRWPQYWSFSFNISPPRNIQGWFPLGLIDLTSCKGLSRIFSNTAVGKHQFFRAQPSLWSSSHSHIWLYRPLSAKCYLSFLILPSRFVIVFLPRSKHVLISWLQSLSAVILEPNKIVLSLFSLFAHLFALKWWDWMPWS